MAGDGFDLFLEIGPHPVLAGAIAESVAPRDVGATVLASLRRGKPERETMLQNCAGAYAAGCLPDWAAVQPGPGEVVSLPAYPWQRERHWLERSALADDVWPIEAALHPVLGTRLTLAGQRLAVFDGDSRAARSWLADHRIFGRLLLPAAAMMEAFAAAANAAFAADGAVLSDVTIERPLVLPEGDAPAARWQTQVQAIDGGRARLELHEAVSVSDDRAPTWRRVATATAERETAPALPGEAVDHPTDRHSEAVDADAVYAAFAALGVDLGPRFRVLNAITRGPGVAQAWVELPGECTGESAQHVLHPVLLDAALQLCSVAAGEALPTVLPSRVLLPLGADRVELRAVAASRLRARVTVREVGPSSLLVDLRLETPDGARVARIDGARFAVADASVFAPAADDVLYIVDWQAMAPLPAPSAAGAVGRWLLLADTSGTALELARELEAAGGRCTLVYVDAGAATALPGHRAVDPSDPTAWQRLLAELSVGAGRPARRRPPVEPRPGAVRRVRTGGGRRRRPPRPSPRGSISFRPWPGCPNRCR